MKKKILIPAILLFALTSCHMEPDKYSDQQIFYGETLITTQTDKENTERNNSFIYNPYKSDEYNLEFGKESYEEKYMQYEDFFNNVCGCF